VAVTFRGRAAVGFAVSLGAVVLLFSGVLDSLAPTPRGLILAAAGVTLLGVVLPLQLRTRTLLKHGVQVQGTVVDTKKDTARSGNLRSRTYHPVVEFTTADGRTVTFTSGLGFGRQPEIGGAVPVRYHHDDPERAEIDRAHIWMLPAAPPLLVGVGLLVAGVVVYLQDDRTGGPTATGAVLPSSREVSADALEVGDCVNDDTLRGEGPVETVDVVPCRQPHDLEVYANVTVPGNEFLGDQALEKFADRSCVAHFKDYVGIPFRDSEFNYFIYVPSEDSWNEGDRLVTCGVVDPDLEKLTGSARGARR
jgi:hypothetical protein